MSEELGTVGTATVTPVTDEGTSRGARIKARRERTTWGKTAFAERAGISRNTLDQVEAGDPRARETSYAKAEKALDDLEVELGLDQREPANVVRLEVPTPDGARTIVVQGPVENIDELVQAVAKILKRMRDEDA